MNINHLTPRYKIKYKKFEFCNELGFGLSVLIHICIHVQNVISV